MASSGYAIVLLLLTGCAYRTSIWVTPAGTESALANVSSYTEANPVLYTLDINGNIVTKMADDSRLKPRRVLPTIQNFVNGQFDADALCVAIGDSYARQRHVKAIVAIARRYDGIDIDYESIPLNMRDDFSQFVTLLASELHRQGKRLSVTVQAKTSDRGMDWRAIGRAADAVKIMAYDFHWSTSEAGQIAPLDWIGRVAAYAAQTIPARRQFWGLPWYGRDWQGRSGRGLSFSSAMQLAEWNVAKIERDPNGELFFRYDDHEVWFQDATSYRMKVNAILREHPWIGGFAMWRSGAEDPNVWVDVNDLNRRRIRRAVR
jgi:spore germination protein